MTMIDQKTIADWLVRQGYDHYVIAFSGGVDSHVLLDLVVNTVASFSSSSSYSPSKQVPFTCSAVHVNHHISPNADHWAEHCQTICQNLAIDCKTIDIDILDNPLVKEKGIEATARQCRYQAIKAILPPNSALLLAHHLDDQAETLLLQLLRGAGPKGLSGMAPKGYVAEMPVLRPLLQVSREAILAYAQAQNLNWVEDESNQSLSYDRNYLRHKIIPLLTERWPSAINTVARSARLCAETERLAQQTIAQRVDQVMLESGAMCLRTLASFTLLEQKAVLRAWLHSLGADLPSEKVCLEILKVMCHTEQDAQPIVRWGQHQVRRYRHELWLQTISSDDRLRSLLKQTYQWSPREQAVLKLPHGQLLARQVKGPGLSAQKLTSLTVKFRRGGEVIKEMPNGPTKTLKSIWQDQAVPPWCRSSMPLIYENDRLLLVPGLCHSHEAWVEQHGWEIIFVAAHDNVALVN